MNALSIQQPWASAIVEGLTDRNNALTTYKPVENRTWPTRHRGPLLIHASQVYDHEGAEWIGERFPALMVPDQRELRRRGQMGAVIGGVNVMGVHSRPDELPDDRRPWWVGPYGWRLATPLRLTWPVALKGRLGIYGVKNAPIPVREGVAGHVVGEAVGGVRTVGPCRRCRMNELSALARWKDRPELRQPLEEVARAISAYKQSVAAAQRRWGVFERVLLTVVAVELAVCAGCFVCLVVWR